MAGKKKKIMMLGAVVLIGGIGVMGYDKVLGKSAPPGPPEPVFVSLEPLLAPVLDHGRFAGYAGLKISLEVKGEEVAKRAEAVMPRLRDAFLRDLHVQAQLRRKGEAALKLPLLKARFRALAEHILGAGTVNAVLVEQALERPPS